MICIFGGPAHSENFFFKSGQLEPILFSATPPWQIRCPLSHEMPQKLFSRRKWLLRRNSGSKQETSLFSGISLFLLIFLHAWFCVLFYFRYKVLELSSGIDNPEAIRWELLGCLAAAWFLVFLCICKGVKSSGKVVYVTATTPYLLLTILLIRGLTLSGSKDGVLFYITPDFDKLKSFNVSAQILLDAL